MQQTTLDEIKESFDLLEGWEERYRYLIDLGRKLPPMSPTDKNETTKVDGCLSQVWMVGRVGVGRDKEPTLELIADSDAAIVRGLIAILMAAYQRQPLDEIAGIDVSTLFEDLGLGQHISMNRRNGFYAMVSRIRREAERAHATVAPVPGA